VVSEDKVDRLSDVLGQLAVLGPSVSARREVSGDNHDFAGRLIDGLKEGVSRLMAAKLQVDVGKPSKPLDVIRHAEIYIRAKVKLKGAEWVTTTMKRVHNHQPGYFVGSVAESASTAVVVLLVDRPSNTKPWVGRLGLCQPG
jgi:hypothetical protein